MAAMVCSLLSLCVCLFACILSGEAGSQISLRSVTVDNEEDAVIITVIYGADYSPDVFWGIPTFRPTGGMVNLDFEQNDTFTQGQGQTRMKIQHEVARTQNSKVFLRMLILQNPDCRMEITFPPFADLIAMPRSTQTFHDLALTLEKGGGRRVDPGADLVLRYSLHLTARLSSPELSKFEVNNPWASYTSFEYAPGDFPVRKADYGYKDDAAFQKDDQWSGTNTSKELDITLYGRHARAGIFTLYFLRLAALAGSGSIVTDLELKQNLYISRRSGKEPVRKNTVFIKNKHSHYLTEYDMPMNLHAPEFSFNVVGNPLPEVSLYRGCTELVGREVEMFERKLFSRYQASYFFRFLNATEAIAGSYNVVARSGTMEAREIMSLGIYRQG